MCSGFGPSRLGLWLDVSAMTRPAATSALRRAENVRRRKCATMVSLDAKRESRFERGYRFLRAVIVGSGATVVDFVVLTSCIRVAGIAPVAARLPALLAGATFQFFGN